MKRRVIIGVVLVALVGVCFALNFTIIDPVDFTGAWYSNENGVCYQFEDGLIECTNHEMIVLNDVMFSGAYSFAKDKAAIFMVDRKGVSEVVELYLVHRFSGDILCETKDGTGMIWFYRNQEAALKK